MTEKVKVYGCGGTGINVARLLKGADDHLDVCFMDSSTSNTDQEESDVYYLRDMDGAGKVRAKTYEVFKPHVEAALITHKPSKGLNIVISSLSGGTGSVIAPLIVQDLLSKDHTVLVVGVSTNNSSIEIENDIKTLKTYNNIALKSGKPISMFYCDDEVRSVADKNITSLMVYLSLITDKSRTKEFDRADLHHFLNYNLVTSLPVGLSNIHVDINNGEVDPALERMTEQASIASTILITTNPDATCLKNKPHYLSTALVVDPNYLTKEGKTPVDVRIDNIVGYIPQILSDLEKEYKEARDKLKTLTVATIAEADGEDDGMVL